MADLGEAAPHAVGHPQSLADGAAREDLDLDAAIGQELDTLGEGPGADIHQRAAAPGGCHTPLVAVLRRGLWCRQQRCRQKGCQGRRSRQTACAFLVRHDSLPSPLLCRAVAPPLGQSSPVSGG
jgi:hypothetical protein